jgi:NADPH:quinone reductase-like Zn-dependent oxidoreductase
MKAAVYKKYGPPEVVQVMDIQKPTPSENEILIKVYASTVNRTDAGFRSAQYFVSRFFSGLFRPKYQVLGCEFSGVVEAIGGNVTLFKAGDRVFGFNDNSFGGHAEFMCKSQDDALAIIPAEMDFHQAAALSEGAHYALNNIRAAKVTAGQNVLVYGATGAIGSAAVQLLIDMNVHVTAVANAKNMGLIKSFGVDEVFDYEIEDFTQTKTRFDFIFDAVGKSSFKQCKPLLKPEGIYISTELGKRGANIFLALYTPLFKGKRVLFPIPTTDKEQMEYLKSCAERGSFSPVIDRSYPLDHIVEAYRYVESGQKTGNVILEIAS